MHRWMLAALCAIWAVAIASPSALADGLGISLVSTRHTLTFAGGRAETVVITVQLSDVRTGEAVPRAATLYVTSDRPVIVAPQRPRLDTAGRATLRLEVKPPGAGEPCRGSFTVRVILDEEEADDTIGARTTFTYAAAPDATGCVRER